MHVHLFCWTVQPQFGMAVPGKTTAFEEPQLLDIFEVM
jgi:hypothetical protein